MSEWPKDLNVGPIREWPGTMTPAGSRRVSPFRSTLTATLKLLDRELYELAETRAHQQSAELLVAIPAGAFRLDGRPRADARATHPGVILSMDTKHGHLSYPCDTFTTWEDNLRAISLALEALRKVDRYGVTRRGEQYRGFQELEATAAPAAFDSVAAALEFLGGFVGLGVSEMTVIADAPRRALRKAQMTTHPDQGGSAADFQRVSLAEAKLREAGVL